MPKLIDDLRDLIAARQVALIIGPEVAKYSTGNAETSTLIGLIQNGVNRAEQLSAGSESWLRWSREALAANNQDDVLDVAAQLATRLKNKGEGEFKRWLRESLGPLATVRTELIDTLPALSSLLLTTNHDHLLEQRIERKALSWRDSADTERVLRGDGSGIIHIYGHWEDPESMLLGTAGAAEDDHAKVFLQSLRMTHSLLLIGFEEEIDARLARFLNWTESIFRDSEHRCYRLVRSDLVNTAQQQHPSGQRFFALGYGSEIAALTPFLTTLVRSRASGSDGESATDGRRPDQDELLLDAAVAAYKTATARQYARIHFSTIAGRAEVGDVSAGLDRLRVFIPQWVRPFETPEADTPPQLRSGRSRSRKGYRSDESDSKDPESREVESLLADPSYPRCMFVGGPGSGKTELTQWLALVLCGEGTSAARFPRELVPVRVELRRFHEGQRAVPIGYTFQQYLEGVSREQMAPLTLRQIETLAERGRLVWMFDGLDEVPTLGARRHYAQMIRALSERYPGRYILTSRPMEVPRLLDALPGFELWSIEDLDDAQIGTFIDRWHGIAFPLDSELRAKRRNRLAAALAESPSIRQLGRNPLLLTLLALLNRGDDLPRRRHLVFQRAVDLMVSQWETHKDLPGGEPEFEREDKLSFLRQLAWRMQNEAWPGSRGNIIDRQALERFAADFCEKQLGLSRERAEARASGLITKLESRNYVLTYLGGDAYGLVHRTFLEYLAADAMTRYLSPDERRANFEHCWDEEDWHEVHCLACGLFDDQDRVPEILGAIQTVFETAAFFHGGRRARLYPVILSWLAEVRHVHQEPMLSIVRALMQLIQQDGRALMLAGYTWVADHLLHALRLFGARWPDPDAWLAWARATDLHGIEREYIRTEVAEWIVACCLAASPAHSRTQILNQLLSRDFDHVSIQNLLTEAERPAPWSATELVDLLSGAATAGGWVTALAKAMAELVPDICLYLYDHTDLPDVVRLLWLRLIDSDDRIEKTARIYSRLNHLALSEDITIRRAAIAELCILFWPQGLIPDSLINQRHEFMQETIRTNSDEAIIATVGCFLLKRDPQDSMAIQSMKVALNNAPSVEKKFILLESLSGFQATRDEALAQIQDIIADHTAPDRIVYSGLQLLLANQPSAETHTLALDLLERRPCLSQADALFNPVKSLLSQIVSGTERNRLLKYILIHMDRENIDSAFNSLKRSTGWFQDSIPTPESRQLDSDIRQLIDDQHAAQLAPSAQLVANIWLYKSNDIHKEDAEAALLDFACKSDDYALRLEAAKGLADVEIIKTIAISVPDDHVQRQAIKSLEELASRPTGAGLDALIREIASTSTCDAVRLSAARYLLRKHLNERDLVTEMKGILAALAATSTDELTRAKAAADLYLLPQLRRIAATAHREHARVEAQAALDRLMLRAQICLLPGQLGDDRLRDFVGREAELGTVRRLIDEQQPTGGYLIISGQAGQGKSCMLAKLVDERGADGTINHFIPLNPGPDYQVELLRSLLSQLSEKHGLHAGPLKSESRPVLKGSFHSVLAQLSARGTREVLFIDGLDQLESEPTGERDLSFLPQTLPPGIVLVLATRPDDTLRGLTLLNAKREYPLPQLRSGDFDQMLARRGVTISQKLSDECYRSAQGIALFLGLIARELSLHEGIPPEELVRSLQQDRTGIFGLAIDRLRRDSGLWERAIKPCLAVFLVSQEPIRRELVVRLLDVWEDQVGRALARLGGLLNVERLLHEQVVEKISLFHLAFKDFLHRVLFNAEEIEQWHRRLADFCGQSESDIWQDVFGHAAEQARREYARRHYLTHLYLGQDHQRLFRILDVGDFGRGSLVYDPSGFSYAKTLDLGRKAASDPALGFDAGMAALPRLWRYSLVRCSLASRADSYPLDAFAAMALLGEKDKAIRFAELLTDEGRRIDTLATIAELAGERPEHRAAAEGILVELVPRTSTAHRWRIIEGLLCLKRWEVAARQAKLLDDADANQGAMCRLVSSLMERKQFEQAERVIQLIESYKDKVNLTIKLACALQHEGHIEQARRIIDHLCPNESFSVGRKPGDWELFELMVMLVKLGRLNAAERICSLIDESDIRSQALARLASLIAEDSSFDHGEFRRLAAAALESARSESLQVRMITLIDGYVAMRDWDGLATMAQSLPDSSDRDYLWLLTVEKMIGAPDCSARAEAVARSIVTPILRPLALASVASRLPPPFQAALWSDAESAAAAIVEPAKQATALWRLAESLAAGDQHQRAQELWLRAATLAGKIDDLDQRGWLVHEIVGSAARSRSWQIADDILRSMDAGPMQEPTNRILLDKLIDAKEWQRAVALANSSSQRTILLAGLIAAQEWNLAFSSVETAGWNGPSCQLLAQLAVGLARAGRANDARPLLARAEALLTTQEAGGVWDSLKRELAERLMDMKAWESAESLIRSLTNEEEKATALIALASRLNGTGESSRATQVWAQLEGVIGQEHVGSGPRYRLLRLLVESLASAQEWERAESLLGRLSPGLGQVSMMKSIAVHAHVAGKAALEQRLFRRAQELSDSEERMGQRRKCDGIRAVLVDWHIALGRWAEAEQTALLIDNGNDRVQALRTLAVSLSCRPDPESADRVIRLLPDGWARIHPLAELAWAYSQATEGERVRMIWREIFAIAKISPQCEPDHPPPMREAMRLRRLREAATDEWAIYLARSGQWENRTNHTGFVNELSGGTLVVVARELIRRQRWDDVEALATPIESQDGEAHRPAPAKAEILNLLVRGLLSNGKRPKALNLVQRSWLAVSSRDATLLLLPMAFPFLELQPQLVSQLTHVVLAPE